MEVYADPKNQELVYVLNAPMMKSIDGGRTFQSVRVGHGDTHDLYINPNYPTSFILGDDAMAQFTTMDSFEETNSVYSPMYFSNPKKAFELVNLKEAKGYVSN